MAKKKITPIVEDAENPAPEGGAGEVGKKKRVRRGKAEILIQKLDSFYGKIDNATVKDLFESRGQLSDRQEVNDTGKRLHQR